MDYYSQFDMPSLEQRISDLLIYSKTLIFVKPISPDKLNAIVTQIASETGDYSMSGYAVFGQKEERDKLEKAIN